VKLGLIRKEEHKLSVVGNMVLRRTFGPKWVEVTGERRRLHKKELNNFYLSPNTIRVMRSRRMGWVEHVAYMA
jgi:hypothetical protein